MNQHDDICSSGLCGADVPPLVGSLLTGTGLTLDAAASRLAAGEVLPPLTDVQRRLVEAAALDLNPTLPDHRVDS
jgi:hypothetical protein